MATRLIINTQTNEETQVAVDDAFLIANGVPYLLLAWDGGTNTLSAQIQTPLLTDETRDNVAEVQTWLIRIGDVETTITTDSNGAWSDTITFADSSPYTVRAIAPDNSNSITIQDGV